MPGSSSSIQLHLLSFPGSSFRLWAALELLSHQHKTACPQSPACQSPPSFNHAKYETNLSLHVVSMSFFFLFNYSILISFLSLVSANALQSEKYAGRTDYTGEGGVPGREHHCPVVR